jgi:uncharacterized membrane protein
LIFNPRNSQDFPPKSSDHLKSSDHGLNLRAWVVLWMGVGAALRFLQIGDKPLWTDEVATLVFSLGHSFRTLPLQQWLLSTQILEPLSLGLHSTWFEGLGQVWHYLMGESTHPPLYFWLAHGWMRLWMQLGQSLGFMGSHLGSDPGPFQTLSATPPKTLSEMPSQTWGSLTVARSLPAVLGLLTIPALVGFVGKVRQGERDRPSPLTPSHWAAVLMATSPLAIYLAQEARHYTLAWLAIIASLTCLAEALQALPQRRPLGLAWCLAWIGANGLGFAIHYFVGLLLIAEVGVLAGLAGLALRRGLFGLHCPTWRGIGLSILGSGLTIAPWLGFIRGNRDSELTQWAYAGDRSWLEGLMPLVNTAISNISMVVMLPVQNVPTAVALVCGGLSLVVGAGLVGRISRNLISPSLRNSPSNPPSNPPSSPLIPPLANLPSNFFSNSSSNLPGNSPSNLPSRFWIAPWIGLWLGAIALFLALDYGLGMQLTSAYRYSFVYLPVVLLLASLGMRLSGIKAALLIGVLLASGLSTSLGFGYQKVHRPDLVAQDIRRVAQGAHAPAKVAIAHRTHGHSGRLMGIAWALEQSSTTLSPPLLSQFYLDSQTCKATDCFTPSPQLLKSLTTELAAPHSPFDLWLVNYATSSLPNAPGLEQCQFDTQLKTRRVDGYRYQHWYCR